MAVDAVCLRSLLGPSNLARLATPNILTSRDRLQVGWVDTQPVATQVVKLQARGDLPDQQLVGNPVGHRLNRRRLPPARELTIAIGVHATRPDPAPRGARSLDPGPEPCYVHSYLIPKQREHRAGLPITSPNPMK